MDAGAASSAADGVAEALQAVSLQPGENSGDAAPAAASASAAGPAAAGSAGAQHAGAAPEGGAGGHKPSKAQKKKAQKAKAEADRESRIKEELSNMGDSSRVLEEQALAQKLKPHGLAVFDIKARERTSRDHAPRPETAE